MVGPFITDTAPTWAGQVQALRTWMTQRAAWLDGSAAWGGGTTTPPPGPDPTPFDWSWFNPAAFDDCYQALSWVAEFAELIGGDSDRIACAGRGSGAALAAAVAIAARDRGGPRISSLHLVAPVLDHRLSTRSSTSFTDTPVLDTAGLVAVWDRFLGERTANHAVPGRLEDAAGLPPAYVEVAQWDPVRDEGIEFAARLLAAGVEVELHLLPGTFHGSEMFLTADVSARAVALRGEALRRALARTAPTTTVR